MGFPRVFSRARSVGPRNDIRPAAALPAVQRAERQPDEKVNFTSAPFRPGWRDELVDKESWQFAAADDQINLPGLI